jgi:F-type H+-transporting ATPase subunit c
MGTPFRILRTIVPAAALFSLAGTAFAQEATHAAETAVATTSQITLIDKDLAMALVMGFGATGPAIGIGLAAMKAMEAIGRNPDASGKVQTPMILMAAFAEAIAIYCLVVALIIKFV